MKEIKFYSTRGEYGYFSSFYLGAPFNLKGKKWKTREHYFQAQKFVGTKFETQIQNCNGPMEAAREGRDRKKPLRKDWESVKFSIMKEAITAQVKQHADLKKKLIDTGDAIIIEHTSNDAIWGDGGNGKGQNLLGKAWMEVREEIKKSQGEEK